MIDTIEIKAHRSWDRQVLEYFEDLDIICNDYNRTILRYLGKLNRLLHEERIDQSEYDALNRNLLKVSEALNQVPRTIKDIKSEMLSFFIFNRQTG
jgi:hypothetical protein